MKITSKNKKQNSDKNMAKSIVSDEVRDYSNEPFFIKKNNEAKAFLEKHPFPREFMNKK